MPKKIEPFKIYDIEIYPNGMRDGYSVRFKIYKNENNEYVLDLIGASDYSSWHKRIDQNGHIIDLENYKGQFGLPHYSDDPDRTLREQTEIKEYNDQLHKKLIQNGLEKNYEDEEFEKNNVIKIRQYF